MTLAHAIWCASEITYFIRSWNSPGVVKIYAGWVLNPRRELQLLGHSNSWWSTLASLGVYSLSGKLDDNSVQNYRIAPRVICYASEILDFEVVVFSRWCTWWNSNWKHWVIPRAINNSLCQRDDWHLSEMLHMSARIMNTTSLDPEGIIWTIAIAMSCRVSELISNKLLLLFHLYRHVSRNPYSCTHARTFLSRLSSHKSGPSQFQSGLPPVGA
jgi:hypothetical protein